METTNQRNNFQPDSSKVKRLAEFKQAFEAYFVQPLSMKELSVAKQIDRASICWYNRDMRHANTIAIAKREPCKITGRVVNKYTTNPALFPLGPKQINMFDSKEGECE